MPNLPEVVRHVVDGAFAREEAVLWCGQPVARPPSSVRAIVLVAAMCILIPTVVCYFAFRSADPVDTLKATAVGGLLMGGLPLGIVLALGLSGRAAWWGAGRTAYVLTDRRAVVFDGGFGPDPWTTSYILNAVFGVTPPEHRVREWPLVALPDQFPAVGANIVGEADVVFEEQTSSDFDDNTARTKTTVTRFGFLSVPDAAAVRDMVAAQRDKVRLAR